MKKLLSRLLHCDFKKQFLIVLFIFLISSSEIQALEGGYGNYVPGLYGSFLLAATPPPGWYSSNEIYFYFAHSDKDFVRQGVIVNDIELNEGYYLLTLAHATEFKILGGKYNFSINPAIGYTDISADVISETEIFKVEDNNFGLSDLSVTPISLYWKFDKIYLNLSETIVVPIGEYDVNRQATLGLNYWSFDTNLAFTYFDKQKGYDISLNFGHIYNTKNKATDYKSGQELHLDYMFNYFFTENFAAGLQGFFHRQITGDGGEGAVLGDFKAEGLGIGTAVLWVSRVEGKEFAFAAKWINELHVENQLKGNYIFFNLAFKF